MRKELTPRQRQVLDAIRNYSSQKGYPPSIRELRPILGVSSLRGVTIHLDALERKGWIKRESTSRSIKLLNVVDSGSFMSIPLFETVRIGQPFSIGDNAESYVYAPSSLARESDELFALKIKGDSFIADHITDGDTIIVRRQNTAQSGDVVAALIGNEVMVTRYELILLSNQNTEPSIRENADTTLLGVVIGLTRSYEPDRTQ